MNPEFFKKGAMIVTIIVLALACAVLAVQVYVMSNSNGQTADRGYSERNEDSYDTYSEDDNEEGQIGQFEGFREEEEEGDEEFEKSVEEMIEGFSPFEPCTDCTIKSVSIGEHIEYKYYGDLWSTAWADNDNVYMMFGDGTGRLGCLPTVDGVNPGEGLDPWPGVTKRNGCFEIGSFEPDGEDPWPCGSFDCNRCYEDLCKATPAGVVELKGDPDNFQDCVGDEQCLVSKDVPFGNDEVFAGLDKPSSMIAIGQRIYAGMHWPPGVVEEGYVAYSDDYARTWTKVEGTPWGKDSTFRVVMYIQMGKANALNTDGFVYALGTPHEVAGNEEQEVRLARVLEDDIANYEAYEYLSGYQSDGSPTWSRSQRDAIVLDTITTAGQGTAMYHPGTGLYLFLSGFRAIEFGDDGGQEGKGALFEADNPWGPWREVARFPMVTQPSFIQKGATNNSVFFNGSGGTFFNGLVVAEMVFGL